MFGFLKKFESTPEVAVLGRPQTRVSDKDDYRTEQEIIQEIHDSYDNATNDIVSWAKDVLKQAAEQDTAMASRLSSLGFTSTAKVQANSKVLEDKKKSEELATLIEHYKFYYPNQKFITREQVAKINAKYKLVCVQAYNYLGDIPEKNLSEIEAFKMRDEDKVYCYTSHDKWDNTFNFISKSELKLHINLDEPWVKHLHDSNPGKINEYEEPFYISCPKKDAKIERGYSVRSDGFVLKDPKDPIVLKPVIGGFLIVTKWGLEASDSIVVDERNN